MSAYGAGTIYRRGSTWWVQWWDHGKCYRESAKTADKDEARTYLRRRMGEVATSGPRPGTRVERVTVADLMRLVLIHYRQREARSLYEVKTRLDARLVPELGGSRVSRLTSHDLTRYVERRRRDGAANGTINRELSLLRLGLNLGRRTDPPLVVRTLHVPMLPEAGAREGFLEQDQYCALMGELPDAVRGLTAVAYHTGARRGELLAIRWEQVDLDAGVIRLSERQTKGKVPRVLPIWGEMARYLRRPDGAFDSDRVFAGADLDCRRSWASACKRAGVPGLLFHDLRRSAVRNMERAGVPRSVAMAISGHKTESVYRRYAIVNESDLRDAGGRLERFMEEGQ